MLSAAQLASIQAYGRRYLITPVEILHREEFAKDSGDVFGDDTVTYEDVHTFTSGWIVPDVLPGDFTESGNQAVAVGQFKLRVPVGTEVHPGDRVLVDTKEYAVVDASTEQTWPEWTVARLRRME